MIIDFDKQRRSTLDYKDMCPKCHAWHGVSPLEHLKPGEDCGHNPNALCMLCGKPVGPLSMGGPRICSWCDCGRKRDEDGRF